MIRTIVVTVSMILLAGCGSQTTDLIPHNRAVVENETLDSVLFTFNNANRFTKGELAHGISIELSNQTFMLLETDFELSIDYYDEGWSELETIDFFTRSHAYSLEREHRIRQTVYTDHFENELEAGRYRLKVDYLLTDEEEGKQESYSIGAVFWIED